MCFGTQVANAYNFLKIFIKFQRRHPAKPPELTHSKKNRTLDRNLNIHECLFTFISSNLVRIPVEIEKKMPLI